MSSQEITPYRNQSDIQVYNAPKNGWINKAVIVEHKCNLPNLKQIAKDTKVSFFTIFWEKLLYGRELLRSPRPHKGDLWRCLHCGEVYRLIGFIENNRARVATPVTHRMVKKCIHKCNHACDWWEIATIEDWTHNGGIE